MLAGCAAGPGHALEMIVPAHVAPTLWDVAACAAMAGCEAAYLPVVAAAIRAVADPAFNLEGVQATTGSAAPFLIVSGPVAAELGINAGANCMGQGSRANATIGRALRLLLQNVGLSIPGRTDMATQGMPGKFTWCIADLREGSPWSPLGEQLGFASGTSTVTAVGAVGNVEVVLPQTTPEDVVLTLARSMTLAGNIGQAGSFGGGQALVIVPPESAYYLEGAGIGRRELQQQLFELARVPFAQLPGSAVQRVQERRAELGLPPEDAVRVAQSADEILVVVAGGVGTKATFVPTWGGGTRAITREVRPL